MDTKQLKQKILDLAIRGKLVPQDPNDEPASVLLERIRKEKEQLIASGKLKKSKSKTTDTPHYENVPFEIPDSWEWVALGDVYQHNTGKALNANDRNGTLKDYITTSNLYWNRFVLQEVRKMLFTESEIERCLVTRGDLLVCEGGDVGRAAIWCYDYDICIQNHIHRLRSILPLCNQFYYYIFYLYKLTNRIGGKGTAIQGLSSDSIDKLLIPLPPLIEQKRIVAEIEKWFALIDDIEAQKSDLQDYIKQTKSKVLDLAIHGKLVPQDPNDEPATELLKRINPHFTSCDTSHYENLPSGWVVTPMQKICDLAEGEKQTGIDRIYLDVKYLRGKVERVIAQNGKYVPAGSTMILVDGENSGEIFTTPVEGYQGSTFKLLDISDEMYKPFILYVIKSYQKQFRENKVGSAIPHLNKKLFREIEVFMPPFDEQKRIVKKIDEIFETIDKITAEL